MAKTPDAAPAAPKIPRGGLNLQNLPMDKVSIKKGFNPRSDLGDLGELKRSLTEQGMQVPVIVCPTKDGADTYYIVAGHRRFTVWQEMGKTTIPASVRNDLTIASPEAFALAVSENSEDVRSSLSPLDQANAFKKMLEQAGGDGNEAKVGKMAGYTVTHVRRTLKLLVVPKAIKERLQKGEISTRAAVAVADVPDDIRDRVVQRVQAGTTEGEVARLVNEIRREARSAGQTAPAAGRGQSQAQAGSRHNVPVGTTGGTFVSPKGMREVRKMLEHVAADALNAREDLKTAEDDSDEAKEAATQYLTKANQLVALLWQVGGVDKMDINTKDFKRALDEIAERLEARMAKDKKADAPPAAAATAAASASGRDDDGEEE